jgi:chromosome partitioning protein
MPAKIITFGIQKGGSSKTTTSGIVSYLLSQDYRVLAVDMDSQGNLTELLTMRDVEDFRGMTVLEAMEEQDASGYICRITDTLHLLPAEDLLATFSRWLYNDYAGQEPALVLAQTLSTVRDNYDYIIIDTAPALGDQTINALAASDYVVAMFEASKFCYSALGRFLRTSDEVRKLVNPDLRVAGILRGLIDARRSDNKVLIELVAEDYGDLCFESVLTRNAAAGRVAIKGLFDNNEIKAAVAQYKPFVEELIERVEG